MRTRKSRWIWLAIIGLTMIALLAACGGSDEDGNNNNADNPAGSVDNADSAGSEETPADDAAGAMTVEVNVVDNAFEPVDITVAPGTTIIWANNGQVQHTVTAGERDAPTRMFDSGLLDPGATFQYTFTEEGTFPYHCVPHPGMDGTVTVASG